MITKFELSWQVFKASIKVTLRYRKLLWFPVLTAFLTAFSALFFLSAMALPVVLQHTGYHLNQKQHWVALKDKYLHAPAAQAKSGEAAAGASEAVNVLVTYPIAANNSLWGSLYLLVMYFASMFLATFFNVAFYSEIIAALNGKGVSFRRGLSTARNRWPSILIWSLLAGIAGWFIRTIEQRLPLAGRLLTGLIGMAWSIAAVFAIPVIIQEQPVRNPIKILQHITGRRVSHISCRYALPG